MIQNKWKKIIESKGLVQSHICLEAGIDKGTWSRVVNGYQMLDKDVFERMLEVVGVEAHEVYPRYILRNVYKIKIEGKAKKRKAMTISLSRENEEYIKQVMCCGKWNSVSAVANAILERERANG